MHAVFDTYLGSSLYTYYWPLGRNGGHPYVLQLGEIFVQMWTSEAGNGWCPLPKNYEIEILSS